MHKSHRDHAGRLPPSGSKWVGSCKKPGALIPRIPELLLFLFMFSESLFSVAMADATNSVSE